MGPKDLIEFLMSMRPSQQPVFVEGSPGIGKSEIFATVAEELGEPLVDIRAVLLDPVDIRGIPYLDGESSNRTMRWAPPCFLPTDPDWQGILFLDELPGAAPLVQTSLLSLTLDRRVGEYKLPDGAWVVAAGNRVSDRSGAHRISNALASRFFRTELHPSHPDWDEWASNNGIITDIRGYLHLKPSKLNEFDPAANLPFPCPRSWTKLSKVLPTMPERLRQTAAAAIIGEGTAAELIAHINMRSQLPPMADILRSPETVTIPTDRGLIYALCCSVIDHMNMVKDKKSLSAIIKFSIRLPAEPATFVFREAANKHKDMMVSMLHSPEGQQWWKKFGHLFADDTKKSVGS